MAEEDDTFKREHDDSTLKHDDDEYTGGAGNGDEEVDAELEAMKQRMKEMEEEAAKLREMQAQVERDLGAAPSGEEDKEGVDLRSIYIGNVDYSATPEEIQAHFQSCGTINRVTILCDKWSGHPKGYAYVEFAEPGPVANALFLNESLFKGRLLKVTAKRTNVPGMSARGGRGRGRGRFPTAGAGGFRGGFRGRGAFPYRARRGYFSPY